MPEKDYSLDKGRIFLTKEKDLQAMGTGNMFRQNVL